eukprot:COSAG04_NODE_9876_length_824_cov_1.419310_2_plen_43_part_00
MLVETIFLRPGGLRPGGSCKAAMMAAEQSKGPQAGATTGDGG